MRTAVIHVPGMINKACAHKVMEGIMKNSGGGAGIRPENIEFRMADRTVLVNYDSLKLSLKNIEHAISSVGFSANDVPADPKAKAELPDECKSD